MPRPKQDYFTAFATLPAAHLLPQQFNLMAGQEPHFLCRQAALSLQDYLTYQQDWVHNFGLRGNGNGTIIGKMFGVLVVHTRNGEVGYLSAFSGKLAGSNNHARFVPAIFDALTADGFLNASMPLLTQMSEEIRRLQSMNSLGMRAQIAGLMVARKNLSLQLQKQLFDGYSFLNKAGIRKDLAALFHAAGYKNPPSGAGECAGPKLLQYAFQQQMQPLALAEFWWGQSPKSAHWQHGHFYPCCKEKCAPIMAHMLHEINAME